MRQADQVVAAVVSVQLKRVSIHGQMVQTSATAGVDGIHAADALSFSNKLPAAPAGLRLDFQRNRFECAESKRRVRRFCLFQGLPAPGEVIVPSKEPVVKLVAKLNERVTMKLPVAPANRPVPPVMVAISTMEKTTGSVVGVPRPIKPAVSVSPLAAVNV